MMAVVLSLIGTIYSVMELVQMQDGTGWKAALGAWMLLCGQLLFLLLALVDRKTTSGLRCPKLLGTAVLAVGTLVILSGATVMVLAWRDPFSWMMAIVGLAIFIDALCLYISLKKGV